jgi:hypothetical protein
MTKLKVKRKCKNKGLWTHGVLAIRKLINYWALLLYPTPNPFRRREVTARLPHCARKLADGEGLKKLLRGCVEIYLCAKIRFALR